MKTLSTTNPFNVAKSAIEFEDKAAFRKGELKDSLIATFADGIKGELVSAFFKSMKKGYEAKLEDTTSVEARAFESCRVTMSKFDEIGFKVSTSKKKGVSFIEKAEKPEADGVAEAVAEAEEKVNERTKEETLASQVANLIASYGIEAVVREVENQSIAHLMAAKSDKIENRVNH